MAAVATKPMTYEEFGPLYEKRPFELVDGQPREIPMPTSPHGYVAMNLGYFLIDHVRPRKLGRVSGLDACVKTKSNPDTVRGADVCYFSYATVSADRDLPGYKDSHIVPDLIGEVNSPSNSDSDIAVKVEEYLAVNVKIVLVLDPDARSVTAHRRDEIQQVFDNGDDLVLPDLLPGFSVPVRSLFEE